MDWLLARQERIERALARRHLEQGTLVLYDVSSSYFEGHRCPLAKLGYSRDGRRGTPQIVYGLLCDRRGCPVAVEVFEGSLHDDKTLPVQIEKLRKRFKLASVIVVSDRGMVTRANLERLHETEGASWITALRAPQLKKLVKDGALQLSLFDQHNLAEIAAEDYPDERLVVCRNPLVAHERARKRKDLLQRPSGRSPRSRPASPTARLQARRRSGSPSARSGTAGASASTSSSRSPIPASPSRASSSRSPPRRRSTASTCSAPASRRTSYRRPTSCAPTSG